MFKILFFFLEATRYQHLDADALELAGERGEVDAGYHRTIVRWAQRCGLGGFLLGLPVAALAVADPHNRGLLGVVLTPFLFAIAGILLGVALACLLAPREFLIGPIGQKWMDLIGTRHVGVARAVCLIFGLVLLVPLVGMGVMLMFAS